MVKGKFPLKRWILKTGINGLAFIIILFVLSYTKLPEKFDTYVYYEDFKFDAWLWLFIYRSSIYFIYPFVVSYIEILVPSRKCIPYIFRLLENFNIQFLTYTLFSALYALFGIDKVLGTDIFGSSDSFMFIGSFILTLLINKSLPNLFYDSNIDNIIFDRKIYNDVDLSSIKHDSNPFSRSRNFLSYEYNNVNNGKELVVVLKNPSKSFVNGIEPSKKYNCIDITTYNVMKTIDECNQKNDIKYQKIIILNLFPEFSTDPEKINKIYKFESRKDIPPKTKCYKNMHKILRNMNFENCDVLYAWGQNNGIYLGSYNKAIEDMKVHFKDNKKLEFDGKSIIPYGSEYPLHAFCWKEENK